MLPNNTQTAKTLAEFRSVLCKQHNKGRNIVNTIQPLSTIITAFLAWKATWLWQGNKAWCL